MNANEVLANRANELLGGKRGAYAPVHPNDHVNMAQSTNDVIPTAIRLAALSQLPALVEALNRLGRAFLAKGKAFDGIVKSGRTHLQDATPVRLGQEFTAYGHTIERNRERVVRAADDLRDLGIGGTAVGTGLNAEPEYPALMVKHLRAITELDLREGDDRVQLMQSETRRRSRGRSEPTPRISARSRATCGCWPPGRAPASPRSCCLPSNPARASCRGRSIRRSPKW
jgi:aspartate ammonia-lyase